MTTGGDIVAEVLAANGVTQAYALLGNQTVSIADGLHRRNVDVIAARHEYNAAVMADTYGRLTGDPGVAITVAGPGGTNALTGVAQAYTAASPAVLIAAVLPEDAPPEALHGVDDPRLLEAAYEPATKWSTQVYDPEQLPYVLNRAFDVTTSGRPGPVFVGIDEEILMDETTVPSSAYEWTPHDDAPIASEAVDESLDTIREATRRVLYVGKGVSRAFANDVAAEIAELLGCPVVCPRHYPDAFPNDHDLYTGTVGMADHPAALAALSSADAVLSLGVRTGSHEAMVMADRTPAGVDIVFFAAGQREPTPVPAVDIVSGDLRSILRDARNALERAAGETDDGFREEVLTKASSVRSDVREYYESVRERRPIHPIVIMVELNEIADDDVLITGDAGAAGGAWPNDVFEFRTPNSFQHSRLYDSMGFPIPAGNAAKLVNPDRQVVNLVGDGGFLMCAMELATAKATGTNAVTVVLNDGKYGMIWNYQRKFGYAEVATDIPQIDASTMAASFGIDGVRIEEPDEFGPALRSALDADEHVVLDVVIDPEAEYVSRRLW